MSKFDLFLSHSWNDKPFVESFKTRVEAKGVRCWIDTEQMSAGAWLFDAIQDGIDDSKIFVAFVSEKYKQSENCNKEFALAVDWKKDILPIRLIEGRWPPKAKIAAGLAGKLYLDGIQPIDENTLDKILENMGLNTRTQKDDVIKKDAVEAVMKKDC
jgi:hypothetical protein